MKKITAIVIIFSLLLNSCTQNKPASQIPVVGEAVDSAAIALDTIQQKSIESSYEYAQSVVVNPKLVYDIRGYGGPSSHGDFAILRRGADNKADTVAKGERKGIIVNAFKGDLNINGREEIYIVMRNPTPFATSYVSGFEFDDKGNATPIAFGDPDKVGTINGAIPHNANDTLADTVYKHNNELIKAYTLGKNEVLKYSYRLQGNKLVRK